MRPRVAQLLIVGASSLLAAALVFTAKLLTVPPRTQARPASAPSPLPLAFVMPPTGSGGVAPAATTLTGFLLWLVESDVRLAAATGGVLAAIGMTVWCIAAPLPHAQLALLKRRLTVFFVTKALLVALILHPLHNAELAVWALWFAVQAGVSTLALTAKYRAALYVGTPQPAERARLLRLLAILLPTHTLLALITVGAFGQLTWSITALLAADNVIAGAHTSIALARYAVTLIDARHEGRWEYKTDALLYIDSLGECATLLLSLAHYCHVWYLHGLALSFIHPLLATLCLFSALALRAHAQYALRYRELSRQLDAAFTDATQEQLAASDDDAPASAADACGPATTPRRVWKECNICLEPMSRGKRLPGCAHMFHRACLRRWLLNGNGTCPLCRHTILNVPRIAPPSRLPSFADDFSHQQYPQPPSGASRTARHTPRAGEQEAAAPRAGGLAAAAAAAAPHAAHARHTSGDSTIDAAVQQLVSAFPHLSARALRRHLMFVAEGDVNLTAEAALRGDIPLAPAPAPSPVAATPPDSSARADGAHTASVSALASAVTGALPSSPSSGGSALRHRHVHGGAPSAASAGAGAGAGARAGVEVERDGSGGTAARGGGGVGASASAGAGARRCAFLHAAAYLGEEEIEAETQALLLSAQLCGCKPDAWALSAARLNAMRQRCRRAYALAQLPLEEARAAGGGGTKRE